MDKYLYNTPMLTSMITGWLMGRRIAGHTTKRKVPIAYLYNGVRLPALPEWDKKEYPYADISCSSIGRKYRFRAWAAKPYCSGDYALFAPVGEGRIARLSCWVSADNSGWGEFTFGELADNGAGSADKPFWSDWDVLDENGAVWLAASDPVPVYE